MAGVRFTELQSRPMEFLDFTSVTLDEFQQLVPPFETAFQCHMTAWRMDGKPRTARRFTVYKTCPLLTPEDRLLFILTYVKTYVLQVAQGRLFSMVKSKANRWIHVLLPVLLAALRSLGDAPARSLTALAQESREMLGVMDGVPTVLEQKTTIWCKCLYSLSLHRYESPMRRATRALSSSRVAPVFQAARSDRRPWRFRA